MTDKLEVLLKLSKIMKQQAEKNLAEAVRHINNLSESLSDIHQKIHQSHLALYSSEQSSYLQSDVIVFEQWKGSQLKRATSLHDELKQAERVKSDLVLKLKTQTVRQDMLQEQIRKSQLQLAAERDELTDERNLEGWLNQNRFS